MTFGPIARLLLRHRLLAPAATYALSPRISYLFTLAPKAAKGTKGFARSREPPAARPGPVARASDVACTGCVHKTSTINSLQKSIADTKAALKRSQIARRDEALLLIEAAATAEATVEDDKREREQASGVCEGSSGGRH